MHTFWWGGGGKVKVIKYTNVASLYILYNVVLLYEERKIASNIMIKREYMHHFYCVLYMYFIMLYIIFCLHSVKYGNIANRSYHTNTGGRHLNLLNCE